MGWGISNVLFVVGVGISDLLFVVGWVTVTFSVTVCRWGGVSVMYCL